jgi:hypothetical protein
VRRRELQSCARWLTGAPNQAKKALEVPAPPQCVCCRRQQPGAARPTYADVARHSLGGRPVGRGREHIVPVPVRPLRLEQRAVAALRVCVRARHAARQTEHSRERQRCAETVPVKQSTAEHSRERQRNVSRRQHNRCPWRSADPAACCCSPACLPHRLCPSPPQLLLLLLLFLPLLLLLPHTPTNSSSTHSHL